MYKVSQNCNVEDSTSMQLFKLNEMFSSKCFKNSQKYSSGFYAAV